MYLLGITGKKQSGKDIICSLIQELLPTKSIIKVAFADALKEEVAKICNVTVDTINQNKERFRPMLQWWGTEFRRKMCRENYWLMKWAQKVNDVAPNTYLVITTDIRFIDEAKIIQECGGKIIKVYREEPIIKFPVDFHSSERELEQIQPDFQILNNGTLTDLRKSVTQLLVDIKNKYINGYEFKNSLDGSKARVSK